MKTTTPYILNLLSSAGLFTFLWFLIQRFITLNHDRKSNITRLLLKKLFLPFQTNIELNLFRFPLKNDIYNMSKLQQNLLEFEEYIIDNPNIHHYVDERLLFQLQKTIKYISILLNKNTKYDRAKSNYIDFSIIYFYLLNKTRKIEGLPKRGYNYRKHYGLYSGNKIFFPITYIKNYFYNYLEKFLLLFGHIVVKFSIFFIILYIFLLLFLYSSQTLPTNNIFDFLFSQ